MKLINKTKYDITPLQPVIARALRMYWNDYDEYKSKLQIEIRDDEKRVSGRAAINGLWMMLNIRKWDFSKQEDKRKFAWVIAHEIIHLNGIKSHKLFNPYYQEWHQEGSGAREDYPREAWVDKYVIDLQLLKPIIKPLVDLTLQRHKLALNRFAKAETRLKRAKTLYKKWKQKVAYYEKKAAMKGEKS